MALVFPPNPSVNDTYQVNGRTYVWNGTSWRTVKGGVPDVVPTLSVDNDFSAGGTLHIDSTNNEIGIGTAAPSHQLHLTQDLGVDGNLIVGGTVTVPTPVAGTNDTKVATTAFVGDAVSTAVSGLLDGAPAALDTLNELAAALNDDASYATTITNALAGKLDLTGGTLSGNLFLNTGKLQANRAGATAGTAAGGIDMLIDGTTYGQIYMNSSTEMLFNASSNRFTGQTTFSATDGVKITGSSGGVWFDDRNGDGSKYVLYHQGSFFGIWDGVATHHQFHDDGHISITDGGDNNYIYFGPNATWGGQLYVGATPDKAGTNTAAVISTDGNLHLDAGDNKAIYLNFYTQGRPINVYGTISTNYDITYSNTGRYATVGAWPTDPNWAMFGGGNGYLLVDSNHADSSIYLRSYNSGGNVYIGAGQQNTLQVGTNSATLNGTLYGGGDFNTNYRLTGSWGGVGAPGIQMRSGNTFNTSWTGSLQLYVDYTHIKNFVIDHPSNPTDQWLIHACAEGPTADVFYRGEAQLENGIVIIELPEYFEDLTELEGRSVMITPIAGPNGNVANLAAYEVSNGRFVVEQVGGYNIPNQRFWWRVDAVRKNTTFPVQPMKTDVTIGGTGPYRYIQEMV